MIKITIEETIMIRMLIIVSASISMLLLAESLIAEVNAQTTDIGKQLVVVPFEDAQFVSLDPGRPDAPELAKLWGDPDQGPSTVLLRIRKGEGGRHLHTSDYHLVLLEGKMKHWADEEEKDDAELLGPGSYWFQSGNQAHVDVCLTDTCLMFVKWEGKMDAALVEPSGENH